jgi:putative DNA primase/helicase
MSTAENFRAVIGGAGLRYAGPIVADSKLHRFKVEGDHNRNSWYVLHRGPPMAGAFGCWKRSIKETWCEREPGQMSQAQWNEVRERWRLAVEQAQVLRLVLWTPNSVVWIQFHGVSFPTLAKITFERLTTCSRVL